MFKRLPVPFIFILAAGFVLGSLMVLKTVIPYLYWGRTGGVRVAPQCSSALHQLYVLALLGALDLRGVKSIPDR